jgi:hypothetical protein
MLLALLLQETLKKGNKKALHENEGLRPNAGALMHYRTDVLHRPLKGG